MATTLKNLAGFQFAIANPETGINIEKISTAVKPEFIITVPGYNGEKRGKVIGPAEATITISGEISGNTGVMAATFATAIALANTTNYFGATGGIYMESANVDEMRTGLKAMSATYNRTAGIS